MGLAIMDPPDFYRYFIADDFHDEYVPKIFKRMARDYLLIQNKARLIKPPLLKVGVYWAVDPIKRINREFDVVTYDELGYAFYEVKYREARDECGEFGEKANNVLGHRRIRSRFLFKIGFRGDKRRIPRLLPRGYVSLEA